ncbi:hypothetical protein SAMN05421813_12314 [Daejeonella rubra]|uniref:Uncharacterized protein n=1 Tax=Daejeonella rubra TaxID=990371 RepID=A0A1G9VZ93_9SPHI|nr:hypothetical protein SAMN05421813_12314 [Daejeonella rubra]
MRLYICLFSAFPFFPLAINYRVEIPFLHLNALILTKKTANRPKVQLDLIEFGKNMKIIEEEGPKQ